MSDRPPDDVAVSHDIAMLIRIMARLRDPERGCPWDVRQTFASIAPYTIEEAYEVADAIERGDPVDLADELGDLLLQVVFHARMAEEAGQFAFGDVVAAITAKMIRRHPHVFGENAGKTDENAVKITWNEIKAAEKAEKRAKKARLGQAEEQNTPPLLSDVPRALPALARAQKIQAAAARYGFDWPSAGPVLGKIAEEVDELRSAIAADEPVARIGEEIGDLMFALVNMARHVGLDAETVMRDSNAKFSRRFNAMADILHVDGRTLEGSDLATMEAAWQAAKKNEGKS